MNQQAYYITKLKQVFSDKQRKNPQYSIRAFSRDIGIDSSSLSKILKGKRRFPLTKVDTLSKNLSFSPREKRVFIESLNNLDQVYEQISIDEEDKRYLLDESYFDIISEWEHYAVLELFELDEFIVNRKNMAFKLGLDLNRVDVVLNNLMDVGLLEFQNGEYVKVHGGLRTSEDILSNALKASHKETMEMGIEKIEEVDLDLRDFSSTTMAIDPKKLNEAKILIREFRQKMDSLLSKGDKSEVYQLAVQFYPLSHTLNKK